MTDKEFRNLEVGKKFSCGNRELKVAESAWEECGGCIFDVPFISCDELKELGIIPCCYKSERKDGKYVVFEDVKNEDIELEERI